MKSLQLSKAVIRKGKKTRVYTWQAIKANWTIDIIFYMSHINLLVSNTLLSISTCFPNPNISSYHLVRISSSKGSHRKIILQLTYPSS